MLCALYNAVTDKPKPYAAFDPFDPTASSYWPKTELGPPGMTGNVTTVSLAQFVEILKAEKERE